MPDPTDEQLDEFRKLQREASAAGPDSPLWADVEKMANEIGLGDTGFDPDDDDLPTAAEDDEDIPEGVTREDMIVAINRLLQRGDKDGAERIKALLDEDGDD